VVRKLALLAILALPLAAFAQRVQLVDRIVAVVNKEVVTLSELNESIASAERQLRRQNAELPDRATLERQMLERLILDKIQLQLARELGIRVDDLQLDRSVQRIAEQNNMTLAEMRTALERDGISFNAYREDLREQIVLSRVREREVDDKVQVSDAEVDLFLADSAAQQSQKVEYNVAHILVRLPEQATPERIEAARAKAEKARAEAAGAADFAKVAASYSDAQDALQGGALGWRAPERLPELFAKAIETMKPGELSPVLRSAAGFHVVKLVGQRGETDAGGAVPQTRLRHILIKSSEVVSETEARRRLVDLRERVVKGTADFAELARVHSQDPTSAKGGDLGWIYPGDTVPDFERAYQALKVGDISEPVKTPFGFHLIQVLERRSADMTPERKRQQARQALRERKSEEAFQEWLRQIRDQAYVELRLEDR
jgi:peptidyl-prolyl cis-trans isomerase SurA